MSNMNWSPKRKSAKSGFELSAALIVAIAVPTFQDSKTADNEASAVRTVHTIVTAEVTYVTMFPEKGFAPDLATLGPIRESLTLHRPSMQLSLATL
jgi:hypothetical protein